MSDKIGILTFHGALSYGANLQAYALQQFMMKLGIGNEIVDYRCEYMINRYQKTIRLFNKSKLRGFVWSLSTAPVVWRKRRATREFSRRYLRLSRPYTAADIKEADGCYRAFVTGSDQVWSPTCVGFDPVYFLTFTTREKKFSYAASIAAEEIPGEIKDEFIRRVSDFDDPSLREESGAELFESLTGKRAHVNIDPSMLLTAGEWDRLCPDSEKAELPYILLFTVPKPCKLVDYAAELARKKSLRVIYLNNFLPKVHTDIITYQKPVEITRFISLIKNAEYVCTNSFHGTAFSVLYHKKFVVETDMPTVKNIRSRDLCVKTGLEARLLSSDNTPDIDAPSDWENVDKALAKERKSSADYLKRIFKGGSND